MGAIARISLAPGFWILSPGSTAGAESFLLKISGAAHSQIRSSLWVCRAWEIPALEIPAKRFYPASGDAIVSLPVPAVLNSKDFKLGLKLAYPSRNYSGEANYSVEIFYWN